MKVCGTTTQFQHYHFSSVISIAAALCGRGRGKVGPITRPWPTDFPIPAACAMQSTRLFLFHNSSLNGYVTTSLFLSHYSIIYHSFLNELLIAIAFSEDNIKNQSITMEMPCLKQKFQWFRSRIEKTDCVITDVTADTLAVCLALRQSLRWTGGAVQARSVGGYMPTI